MESLGKLWRILGDMGHRLWRVRSRGRRFVANRLLFYMALRTLAYRKLRTLLTVFGIVVGIGAIFFLLSFGLGLRDLVTKQVIGDQSIKSIDVSSPNSKVLKLDAPAVNRMSNLPHVGQVSRTYSYPGIAEFNKGENDTVVYGVDANYAALNSFTLVAGRVLAAKDNTVAVVNSAVLQNWHITNAKDAVGKEIKLSVPLQGADAKQQNIIKQFTVVGVIESTNGSEIFIPAGIFDVAGVSHYSQVKIVADDTASVENLRKQIESQGFLTSSPIDTLAQINQVFKFFTIILAGFGAVGMIVAVLGMFNTLTISLLERTREIGLMFALGARRGDMYRLFVFEAMILSLLGSVIGIVGAMLLGGVVDIIMNAFAHSRGVRESIQLFSYPVWLVVGMILFMLCVGFLVVLFPARRAKRINPIDALRRE